MQTPDGMNDPLQVIFSAALGLSALLFGVFGFLYTLYATHLAQLTKPDVVPILPRLRVLCKLLSILTLVSIGVTGVAVLGMRMSGLALLLAWVLVSVTAAAAGLALYLAFRTMGENR